MKYRKIVLIFMCIIVVIPSVFLGTIIYYDPLKLFHKPWHHKEYLQSSMREQAAGILRYWEYDSLIIGTSVLQNTSAREASNRLGGKFINISTAGSDYFERSHILKYALKNKDIKKVVYSLDDLGKVRWGDSVYSYKNWDYLYDENELNDIKIYLNKKYLTCLFSFRSKDECMGNKRDFDRPGAWYNVEEHIKTFGGFENWLNNKNRPNMKHLFEIIDKSLNQMKKTKTVHNKTNSLFGITRSKKYINEYILTLTSNYPRTEFIFIVPPYSRLAFSLGAQTDITKFIVYLESLKYMVRLAEVNSNIKVYAWGNESFLDNISNYRDLTHFSKEINSRILESIENNDGLMSVDMIDKYIEEFAKKATEFDFTEIKEKIRNNN